MLINKSRFAYSHQKTVEIHTCMNYKTTCCWDAMSGWGLQCSWILSPYKTDACALITKEHHGTYIGTIHQTEFSFFIQTKDRVPYWHNLWSVTSFLSLPWDEEFFFQCNKKTFYEKRSFTHAHHTTELIRIFIRWLMPHTIKPCDGKQKSLTPILFAGFYLGQLIKVYVDNWLFELLFPLRAL